MYDSIRDHRIIVAAATLDELDSDRRKPSDEIDEDDIAPSVADTEHADNTHPYLMRYADIYAHSQEFSDGGGGGADTKFIKISRSCDQGEFKKGESVMYHDKETNSTYKATIIDVHYDERKQPHYDLMFKGNNNDKDGKEDTVRLSVKDDFIKQQPKAPEAVSESITLKEVNAVKCVNFDINPTPLFVAMYDGKWEDAQKRLNSHPEEASVWVARYNTNSDDKKVFRWRLLPLHLCVALGGSDDDAISHTEAAPDIPDDEMDEMDKKLTEETEKRPPPRTLLAALLKAYPQATQCTDDQNLIPLHSAIRSNASLAVIEDLLEADPASVTCKDARGRNTHILATKVYSKLISDNKTREMKYARLKILLNSAESHPDARLKKEQQHYESRLTELENENLTLRRDCALLRSRCEHNEDLLDKLVQKLHEYQQKMDDDVKGDEIFGDKVIMDERREEVLSLLVQEKKEVLPSPSAAIKDEDVAKNWKVAFDPKTCKSYYFNKKTRVVTWVKPKCLKDNDEEKIDSGTASHDNEIADNEAGGQIKVLGGAGAYTKRMNRHIQTAMSYEKDEGMSAETGATEAATIISLLPHDTWEGRNVALELESFDETDEDVLNKPFPVEMGKTSGGEAVQDISSSTIFRLSSTTENVPYDTDMSSASFTNAGAFSYADMVKVGEKEKDTNVEALKQPNEKTSSKDVAAPEKKEPESPDIRAEIERLRRKFSYERD